MAEEQAPQQPQKAYDGFMAEIVEINPHKTGMFGSTQQCMCRILEGKDKGRVMRRNISGRAKVGDIIRLGDTSREDKPINVK
jgi:small subunit ribosomal protein S28e